MPNLKAMLQIKQFSFNPFGVSTFVVYDPDTLDALVVDPGMVTDRERALFDNFVASHRLKIGQIVNTHMHPDHCFGDNYVRDRYGAKVAASVLDAPLGRSIGRQAADFGIALDGVPGGVEIDVPLSEGDTVTVGNYRLSVLHVPGHSPGSLVLYCPEAAVAIVGDVLFRGSVGRTDLPGGDHRLLLDGIRAKLLPLPGDTLVLPGHGPATTIGAEKAANPYLK